jgi:hypothetical protein
MQVVCKIKMHTEFWLHRLRKRVVGGLGNECKNGSLLSTMEIGLSDFSYINLVLVRIAWRCSFILPLVSRKVRR